MIRFVFLFSALAVGAFAQANIGVINTQMAVTSTAEIRKAQAAMEAKFKPRQAEIEKIQKEIAGLQGQLQAGQGKLTPQAEQDIQMQGQRRQRELQRLTEDLQQDVDREREEILQRVGGRMQQVVQKLAESRGLDVVVDAGNTIYFKPTLDITKDATSAYDQAHPAQ